MKIAFYDVTSTTSIGGVQTMIWELSNEFAMRGIEVHVYGGNGDIRPQRLHSSIKVFTFPYIPRERIPDLGSRFQRIIERLSMTFYARKTLLQEGYDIIILTKPFDFTLPFLIRDNKKTRSAFISEGRDFFPGDKYLSRRIDIWFACSHFNAWQIMSHYKKSPRVIYNGVDTERFRPIPRDHDLMRSLGIKADETVFIFAGRIVGWKGVRYIVEAMASPAVHKLPVKLLIIGNGPEKHKLQRQTALAGLEERVCFLDFVPHSDLPRLYSLADVAIYPSIGDEAFGNSIAEAMACEKPVIATYNGGIPEVTGTEGRCGFLVSLADAEEIAERMILLIRDPDMRLTMGKHARERVIERFTWKKTADRFFKEIDNLQKRC